MGVSGNLRTMTLPDVLQWIGVNRKTGLLELERGGNRRAVAFNAGRIIACSLNDPMLLGHFLLSSGQIRTDRLQEANDKRQRSGRSLADVVVAENWVARSVLRETLAAQAEEIVYGLFDWIDANFEFVDDAAPGREYVEVDLAVDEILLNGLQRLDETKMIRRVFHTSGVVLQRTGTAPPAQIANSGMARRILQTIDGERTLAAILRDAQASDFLVLKFLYHLYHKDVLCILATRPVEPGAATLVDELPQEVSAPAVEAAAPAGQPTTVSDEVVQSLADLARQLSGGLGGPLGPTAAARAVDPPLAPPGRPEEPAPANPCNPPEPIPSPPAAANTASTHGQAELHPTSVPLIVGDIGDQAEELPSEYQFLLAVIDGRSSIEQILGVSPFSDATVMQVLEGLAERGIIAFQDPS